MRKRPVIGFTCIILLVFLAGCSKEKTIPLSLDSSTTANSLLPEMTDYKVADSNQVFAAMNLVAKGTVVVANIAIAEGTIPQDQAFTVIDKMTTFIKCYEVVGAVDTEGYLDNDNPFSAGLVVIGDKNEISDPVNFFRCLALTKPSFSFLKGYDYAICGAKYEIETPSNSFYITYMGTTKEICYDICDNLQGCEKGGIGDIILEI